MHKTSPPKDDTLTGLVDDHSQLKEHLHAEYEQEHGMDENDENKKYTLKYLLYSVCPASLREASVSIYLSFQTPFKFKLN